MNEILVKSGRKQVAIVSVVIMAILAMLFVYLSILNNFDILILPGLVFCVAMLIGLALPLAYSDIPLLKIAPDRITFRKPYSKEFKQLLLNEISDFEFVLNKVSSYGFVTGKTLIIKVKLKSGGTRQIKIGNPDDPEALARTLYAYHLRANGLSAPRAS